MKRNTVVKTNLQVPNMAEFIFNHVWYLPEGSWPGDIITVYAWLQKKYHIYRLNSFGYWELIYQ